MSKIPVCLLVMVHMNAIEDNQFQVAERKYKENSKPETMSVSAHWYTRGTKINNEENQRPFATCMVFKATLWCV